MYDIICIKRIFYVKFLKNNSENFHENSYIGNFVKLFCEIVDFSRLQNPSDYTVYGCRWLPMQEQIY